MKLGVSEAGLKSKQRVSGFGAVGKMAFLAQEDTVQPGIKVVSHQQAAPFCLALTGY